MKDEIRKTNIEIRDKHENRILNDQNVVGAGSPRPQIMALVMGRLLTKGEETSPLQKIDKSKHTMFRILVIRICFGFRASNFEVSNAESYKRFR